MKLTNTLRDAFIKSVMNDVPRIDYSEQARRIVETALHSALPPKLRALHDDKELRQFLSTDTFWTPGVLDNVETFGGFVQNWQEFEKRFPAETLQIETIAFAAREQQEHRRELRAQLKAVAYGRTTDGALRKALPEFAKYLPTEPPPSANLPAVVNVVADFVKAGWPKGEQIEGVVS